MYIIGFLIFVILYLRIILWIRGECSDEIEAPFKTVVPYKDYDNDFGTNLIKHSEGKGV